MKEPIEPEAFVQLLENNRGIIVKICNSYCPDPSYREDLAQEITYHLWKSGSKYDPAYRFSTWMYRVALNVAISFYRKEQAQKTWVSYTDEEVVVPVSSDPDHREQDILLLEKLISQLNALDKALMILYLDAKPYAEIAEIVGITETNVATRISRVKNKLKQQFSNDKQT